MSLVQVLLSAEAAAQDRAVPRSAYRHRHLADAPLVVTVFNLSGEAAAPLGFCYGTDRDAPTVVIAAEPRNRDCRFAGLNAFSAALVKHLAPFLAVQVDEEGWAVAEATPQVVVPNRATREFLGARLGRSLRYLGLGKNAHPVPPQTIEAGAHLSFLAGHALYPGQSLFLAATELLSSLFATGQSELEDENLASLLAWIRNPARSGRAAIEQAERAALGPVPHPDWEVDIEPHVRAWSIAARAGDVAAQQRAEQAVRQVIAPRLVESYRATFDALSIARQFEPAPSVARRWETIDHREWSQHAGRWSSGSARFSKRDTALRAARMLELWSQALERLAFEETLEDPLHLAELDAEGGCLVGTVASVDLAHCEVKPRKKRATQVPLVELRLSGRHARVPGDKVRWAGNPSVVGELREVSRTRALVAILEGHAKGSRLPNIGAAATFVALEFFEGRPPKAAAVVPWTHEGKAPAVTAPDESSDVPLVELAESPVLGAVSESDIPGVVQ